jgi:hypothetical protein
MGTSLYFGLCGVFYVDRMRRGVAQERGKAGTKDNWDLPTRQYQTPEDGT